MEKEGQEQVVVYNEHAVEIGRLYAFDAHGNGRSNKLWEGKVDMEKWSFSNLEGLRKHAHKRGYTVHRV